MGEGVRGASAGSILEAIREERPMGYLGCLPATDLKDIANYLQSLRSSGSNSRDRSNSRGGSRGRD